MARVNAFGLDELFDTFKKEAGAIDKETGKKMLEAGADVLVAEMKQQMLMYGILDRGTTIKSIMHEQVQYGAGGYYIEVYPAGIRKKDPDHKKGTRNALIAFLAEYGTAKVPARPFMAYTVKVAADDVADAMMKVWKERDR